MTMTIEGDLIETVSIIDDSKDMRAAISMNLEDLGLNPNTIEDDILDKETLLTFVKSGSQGVICDHNLKVGNYSNYNGAELVSMFNKNHIPSILCTQYNHQMVQQIRKHKEHIPVLVNLGDYDELEVLQDWFSICINEHKGKVLPSRKTWQSTVRIESIDVHTDYQNSILNVKIPEWDTTHGIGILMSDIPCEISKQLKEGSRLKASVNTGAEKQEELFFKNWQLIKV